MAHFRVTIGASVSLVWLIAFSALAVTSNELKINDRSHVCVVCASEVVGEFVILVVQVLKIESRWLISVSRSAPR